VVRSIRAVIWLTSKEQHRDPIGIPNKGVGVMTPVASKALHPDELPLADIKLAANRSGFLVRQTNSNGNLLGTTQALCAGA
jgi:hypothetical protein